MTNSIERQVKWLYDCAREARTAWADEHLASQLEQHADTIILELYGEIDEQIAAVIAAADGYSIAWPEIPGSAKDLYLRRARVAREGLESRGWTRPEVPSGE